MSGLIKSKIFEAMANNTFTKAQKVSDPAKRQKLLKNALFEFVGNADIDGASKAIKEGADVCAKTELGITPLMISSNVEISFLLLKEGANIEDLDLNTALSAENKLKTRQQYKEYLKTNGLDTKQKKYPLPDKKTQAMLDFDDVPDVLSMKLLELLAKKELYHAAKTSHPKKHQDLLQSALFHFMEISDIKGMDMAIKAGADVNMEDDLGHTLMMTTVSPKTTLFVLEHGGHIEDLDFNFRLKPKQKMITRREFERRAHEKSTLNLIKKNSKEI